MRQLRRASQGNMLKQNGLKRLLDKEEIQVAVCSLGVELMEGIGCKFVFGIKSVVCSTCEERR